MAVPTLVHTYQACLGLIQGQAGCFEKRLSHGELAKVFTKATPNKFPVSRPPPASISSEHQKFNYFRILSLFPCFLVYSGV